MSDRAKVREEADRRHAWHTAINEFSRTSGDHQHFMYEAKDASSEVERLQRLFKADREGTLPLIHKQCSQSPEVVLQKNELGCCLGVRVKECKYIAALDGITGTDEDRDRAKAWTCVTHVLMNGGDARAKATSSPMTTCCIGKRCTRAWRALTRTMRRPRDDAQPDDDELARDGTNARPLRDDRFRVLVHDEDGSQ